MNYSLITILLLIWAIPLQAAPLTRPFNAEYSVHYNGFKVGKMSQSYSRGKDGSWVLETKLENAGLLSWLTGDLVAIERTELQLIDGHPVPLNHFYSYTRKQNTKKIHYTFDRDKQRILVQRDGTTEHLPLHGTVYDKESYTLALRHDLSHGTKDPLYHIVDRGKLKKYKLQIVGQQELTTSIGRLSTTMVRRKNSTIWLATDHDYLVVQVEHIENGNTVTSYLISPRPFIPLGSNTNSVIE